MQVRILDSRPGLPAVAHECEFDTPCLTLRELIRRRVFREVERFNRDRPATFDGLVQPDESERMLNGREPSYHFLRPIDPYLQFDRAIQAFEHQRFLVIAAGRQVESLDQIIDLSAGELEFIKLVPLVGG